MRERSCIRACTSHGVQLDGGDGVFLAALDEAIDAIRVRFEVPQGC
jgi:hypothetical protein